jgi:hypothetical protein
MLLCDTGVLLAAGNMKDHHHAACLALATKSRAARTCSGTAGIVTLWRDSAADIKDTEPPRPRKGTANNGGRRTDAPSTPPAASSHRPPAWLPGSPAHPRSHVPDYARPSNIKSGPSGPTEHAV